MAAGGAQIQFDGLDIVPFGIEDNDVDDPLEQELRKTTERSRGGSGPSATPAMVNETSFDTGSSSDDPQRPSASTSVNSFSLDEGSSTAAKKPKKGVRQVRSASTLVDETPSLTVAQRFRLVSTYYSMLASRAALVPLLPKIENEPKNKELFAGLAIFAERTNCLARVLRSLVAQDMAQYDDSVLFRETTPLLRLVTAFFDVYSAQWLKTFLKKPAALLSSAKAKKLAEVGSQLKLFNDIVRLLSQLKKKLPIPVMKMLMLLTGELVNARHQPVDSAFEKIACATLFLRYFCPYLVSLVLSVSDSSVRQGYLTAVKMLQCLASDTRLESSVPHSPALNAAIVKARSSYTASIQSLMKTCQAQRTTEKLATPMGTIKSADMSYGLSLGKMISLAVDFTVWSLSQREFLLKNIPGEQRTWYSSNVVLADDILGLDLTARTQLFHYSSKELFFLLKL